VNVVYCRVCQRGDKTPANTTERQLGSDTALKRELAKRILNAMNERGWNGSELARRASKYHEVTRDNVSNYLNGKQLPGPAKLNALAKAFGMEATELLPHRRTESSLPAPTQMRDMGNGLAHLNLDRVVPFNLALDILRMIEQSNGKDNGNNEGQNDRPARRRVASHR
jgi:transcriptional regulator with XRE-family HTH domain